MSGVSENSTRKFNQNIDIVCISGFATNVRAKNTR
jgi:hypothetical protein